MAGPLSHIRILDLSRIMAGPWATQILADLGADVIKVERIGVGDDTRRWGPPWLKDEDGKSTGESGYYLSVNRGKRSIEIDLASTRGQTIVREIAKSSDIVIENFKSGTLKRYGLAYEDIRDVKPDIIYASITGFGIDGPRRDEAAYDFVVQGMGGLMSVTGEADSSPGGGPQKVGVPVIDIMTGMYATVAVLAALCKRGVSGEGEHIDVAMLDVSTALLANQAMNFLVSGVVPKRRGNRHPNIQPQDVFPTSDGHIILAVGNDEQFARFAGVLGVPEWTADTRYTTNAARVENLDTLHPLICDRLKQRTLSHWIGILNDAKVPCGPINTVPMVFEDPQVIHRRMLRDLPHPLAGTVRQVVSPMKFGGSKLEFNRPPPLLGQHSDEVLAELGIDLEEMR